MQNEGDIKDAFIVNNQFAIRKQQSGNLQNQPQNNGCGATPGACAYNRGLFTSTRLDFTPLLFCLLLTLLLLANCFTEEGDLLGITRKLVWCFENSR